MGLLDLALDYARRGWPVFPLEPGGKQPLGRLAPHGLLDATTDPEQIRRWWAAEPEANIGIRTGDAFDVLDLDSREAVQHFGSLCLAHGLDPQSLPRVRTGGGGRHVLFAPTGLGNRARVWPDVDWRGRGGYVVAAGSRHASGQEYRWLTEPNGTLPEAPDWLLETVRRPQTPPPAVVVAAERPPESYVRAAVEREIGVLRRSTEGSRNDQLNRSAFALGQLIGAGWLDRTTAEEQLRAAAHWVGLHGREVEATIRSGIESGIAEPRQPPPGGWSQAEPGGMIGRPPIDEAAEIVRDDTPTPPWPTITDDAFVGLANEVVWTIDPYTEADPVAVLAQFLALYGCAVGPGPHFLVGATRHECRVNVGLVGRSSKARKGDSWVPVQQLLTAADPTLEARILGGFGSGEAIVHAVRDERYETRDEEIVLVDPGVSDKRLAVLETELSSLLVRANREGSTISQNIRDAFDGRPLRNLVKHSPAQATHAHVVVIGHSTIDEIRRRLNADQINNGFANRFLWLAVRRSKLLPSPEPFQGAHVGALALRIRERLERARQVERMRRSPDAEELWCAWYAELSRDRWGLTGTLADRAEALVLRLSLIYALLDGSEMIGVDHLRAARSLWEYAEMSVDHIFGPSSGDVVADKIVDELRHGPMTRSEIYREVFHCNIKAERLMSALALLQQRGVIERTLIKPGGRGRPSERWSLTDGER